MIQPHELQIGSILQDKYGNICTVEAIQYNGLSTDKHSGLYNEFSPIPLTEKILTEWCGCNEIGEHYRIGERLILIRDGKFVDYGSGVELPYLHIFQRLILALTNQPLKIEIK
jgi:hypothetical protein